MPSNSFYPSNEVELILWLKSYAAKLPEYGALCGLSNEEISNSLKDTQYQLWLYEHLYPAKRQDLKALDSFKIQMLKGELANIPTAHPEPSSFPPPPPIPAPGIEKRRFSEIARLKTSLSYNDLVGQNLGIIATVTKTDHPFPEYTLTEELGPNGYRICIFFKKYRHNGIYIESRINGGEWAFLAVHTVQPFLDERPISQGLSYEVREYRLRWWDKSVAHGEWSAIQKIAVGTV